MRDRYLLTRNACYISYTVQAIAVNIAPLFFVIFRENYGLSFTDLGSLVLFVFLVQLTVDIAAIKIIERLGYKKTAILANATAAAGLVLLSILPKIMPPFWGLIVAALFYSAGAGLIEVVINPIVEALPNENIGASLTLLHSFYGWGQTAVILVSTIILYFISTEKWHTIPLLWALIPLFNVFLFIKAPVIESRQGHQKHTFEILKNPVFILFLLIMLCGGSTEMVIAQWASYFAEKGLGVSKVTGDLLGPCIFGLMMAVGRTLYGFLGTKIPMFKALVFCSLIATLSYVGIALIPNPVIVMLFFALAGISASLMWPGTLSASSTAILHGGTAMFAFLAFAGDAGCSLGPWINGIVNDLVVTNENLQFLSSLGFSAEQASLREAILITAVFPLVMLIVLSVISRKNKNKSGNG